MKFFTPDLLDRFGSEDDNSALEAHQELEARSEEYLRHLHEIEEELPHRLRELLAQYYLHDSRLIAHSSFAISEPRGQEGTRTTELIPGESASGQVESRLPSFWIALKLDTPPREVLVLQYRSVRIEEAHLHQTLRDEECPHIEWLYDEVELIPTGRELEFRHSILFTDGLELRLKFKDFDFAPLKPIEAAPEFAKTELLLPRAGD